MDDGEDGVGVEGNKSQEEHKDCVHVEGALPSGPGKQQPEDDGGRHNGEDAVNPGVVADVQSLR